MKIELPNIATNNSASAKMKSRRQVMSELTYAELEELGVRGGEPRTLNPRPEELPSVAP